MRVRDPVAPLVEWLGARQDANNVQAIGQELRFVHEGDEVAEAELLRSMIQAGFRVVAFGAKSRSLEDVFMHVTEGLVQ